MLPSRVVGRPDRRVNTPARLCRPALPGTPPARILSALPALLALPARRAATVALLAAQQPQGDQVWGSDAGCRSFGEPGVIFCRSDSRYATQKLHWVSHHP